MPPTEIRPALLSWLMRSLGRETIPWTGEQAAFLESILASQEGARVLGSLVVTTLRLRQTAQFKPDELAVGSILPSIEAFWKDPSPETYRELRIARW